MADEIKFGTDGWRAVIAEDYTFENVRTCAQAVADYLHDTGAAEKGFVVGFDTRFASDDFAAAVAEVLAGNGIVTHLCDRPTPTPVVSFSILKYKAAGAAVITASHNPPNWNGFKYKPEYAGSASPEVVAQLEKRIAAIRRGDRAVKRVPLTEAMGKAVVRKFEAGPDYLRHVGGIVALDRLRNAGLTVAVDSMFGAGAGYFQELLGGGSTRVVAINQERNPLFPGLERPEPIDENLHGLRRAVIDNKADVGLATDGDADRIGWMDENGRYLNQLWTYGLLALYLLEVKQWRGPMVKSLSTTSMIDILGKMYGLPVIETWVGFKYIGPKMMEMDAIIGGEESGGFAFRGHIPERDGILSGLFLLDMMVELGKTPSQLIDYLFAKVGPHYYDRMDFTFPPEKRVEILDTMKRARPASIAGTAVESVRTDDGFKYILADGSWLLVRFSGTEPVIRIYAETDSPERLRRILQDGREMAGL